MRIPLLIDFNAYGAYKPLDAILKCLVKEQSPKVLTETIKCSDNILKTLKHVCLQTISDNFEKYPIIQHLPDFLKRELLKILSCDLNLQLAISIIEDEYYWKKRFKTHYPSKKMKTHLGWTWKCVYLEEYLAKACGDAEPDYTIEEFRVMQNLLNSCSNYVHVLHVTRFKEKNLKFLAKKEYLNIFSNTCISFEQILQKLTFLRELHISFGAKSDIELNYAPHKLLVDPKDCDQLGKAVEKMKHLKILEIHNSKIGDVHVKHLVRNLLLNKSLEILELPFCQIGDTGAKCIAMLLNVHPNIKYLNLRCNKIGTEGVFALAWSLVTPEGTFLDRLDLSLNKLNDQGVLNFCRGLVQRCTLKELLISGCGVSGLGATSIALMLKFNKSLEFLDISENEFGIDGGEKILKSIKYNNKLIDINMDETNIPINMQENIEEVLKENRLKNNAMGTDFNFNNSYSRISKFSKTTVNTEDPPMDML